MFLPTNPWPVAAPHWLYDEIMRHIEPDLMIERIPLLDKKYAAETADQHQARMEHYDQAFRRYDAWHDDVVQFMSDETIKVRKNAQAEVAKKEGGERAGELNRIEQEFDSLSHS